MSEPTPEQLERVGAWIREEAATRTIDESHQYILERLDRLFDVVGQFQPEDLVKTDPVEGWSPIQTLKHLIEWNWQVGEDVLHVSLTGERPGNPTPEFLADRDQLIARQRESIESVYAHVSAADPDGFLTATWEHPMFGLFNWREWFLFLAVHTIDHTRQLQAMRDSASA